MGARQRHCSGWAGWTKSRGTRVQGAPSSRRLLNTLFYSFLMHNMRIRCYYSLICCIAFVFVQFNHGDVFCRCFVGTKSIALQSEFYVQCAIKFVHQHENFLWKPLNKGNGRGKDKGRKGEGPAWIFCPGPASS